MNRKIFAAILYALALVIVYLILKVSFVDALDKQITAGIFRFFYFSFQNSELTKFMILISEYAFVFVIGIFAYTLAKNRFGAGMRLVIYILFLYLFIAILQQWFGRPRPFVTIEDIKFLTTNMETSFGLPSAHSALSFFVATYFVEELKGYGFKVRAFEILSLIVASLIAFSRVYVGVHYLGDVIVGMLIGISSGIIFIYFDEYFKTRVLPQFPKLVRLK